jgi:hypothetical protein
VTLSAGLLIGMGTLGSAGVGVTIGQVDDQAVAGPGSSTGVGGGFGDGVVGGVGSVDIGNGSWSGSLGPIGPTIGASIYIKKNINCTGCVPGWYPFATDIAQTKAIKCMVTSIVKALTEAWTSP